MSAALPYLNKLRKSDLVDFAEITGLNGCVPNYPSLLLPISTTQETNVVVM